MAELRYLELRAWLQSAGWGGLLPYLTEEGVV